MGTNSAPIAAPTPTPRPDEQDYPLFVSSFSGQVYVKGSLANPNGPITSILTYPAQDYAGDRVKPDGGDWSAYPQHPYVNWSHRVPIGRGEVSHKTLKHDGQFATVAVGKTTFLHVKADMDGLDLRRRNPKTHRFWNKEAPYTVDEVLTVATQAERLVRDDIAIGVSIEFDVREDRKGVDWYDLSTPSVLENRQARQFDRWRGLGYAHARQQVNPGCQTLFAKDDKTAAALEKAITVAQTGKLPGGEIVCKAIMETFQDLKNYRSSTVSVLVEGTPPPATPLVGTDGQPVEVKGVVAETPNVATSDNKTPGADGSKMGAGHQTGMDIVQGLMDLCGRAQDNGSDDPSLRKFFKKVCARMKDFAGDIKARIEKHKGKLDKDGDDDTDPTDEDDYSPTTEEKAIEMDDKGAVIVKAFPDWKPRRMTFDNIVDTPPPQEPAPVQVKSDPDPNDPNAQVSPEEERKARKRLKQAMKFAEPFLKAAQANGRL